ncbi:receptor-type tyrosine-protein phosphatase alpha-like [Haliotis asinina]|uniref:receptor-type tyrosine-protein phosphatase alpha-like n=1 Tax=Haliotis asinina TaxID=109174 RepID=UPI003531DCCD
MCSFWMGLLVVCVTATATDAECHCNTADACVVFPSTPCSQVGDPDTCHEGWFGSYCQKQNIALGRSCNQTSTLWNNVAGNGVDGIVTLDAAHQACAHTTNESNPTWTVNLNTSVPEKIQHIRLYIRQLLQERSNGMEILVGNQMCYNWSSTEHPPPIANVTCRQPLTGTTVTIRIPGQQKYLTLCEVQIFVCSNGWFSEECDKQCRCLNTTDVCDKITGHCSSGCFPGYNGTDCQTVCPNGTYGNNCSSKCGNCLNEDICDKTNGTCPGECEAGWMNSTCTQVCPNGTYGNSCSSKCGNCLNEDTCDKTNGTCPGGCEAGWMNSTCTQACPNGTYGNNCFSKCGHCLNEDICDKINGTCPGGCEAGWINSTCTQVCPNGTYGNNCSSKCGHCLNEDICDKINGTCPGGCEAGWINSTCTQVCPNGAYGNNCFSKCGHCLNEDICDKINGTCPRGCEAGWINSTCSQACPDGSYGTNCSLQCGNCLDGVSCDKTNGICSNGCAPGWINDTFCQQPCNNGSYGINCSSECGNCMCGVSCDKATGTCPDGCAAGWVNDDKCNQACPNGSHGNNCAVLCGNCLDGAICAKTNGACPKGCAAGWMNDDTMLCVQRLADEGSPAGIVGGVIAAVVVVAVVVAILIFRKRRKRKDDNESEPVQLEEIPKTANRDKPSSSKPAPQPPPEVEEDEDAVFLIETEVDGGNDGDATYYNWVPPHIRLDNLKQCISEKKEKGSFESEFQTIPYGARHPHVAAIKPENIPKNRFLALYAYDASRVVLANGEDYINANYIAGYDDDAQYIATQGPKPGTVPDFWRMVWQEDVTQIAMLTRLMEMNKKKCEQYWPDGGKSETYGSCKVTNKNVSTRADYTVSTFLVENSGVERTVTHYHFTSWPDHGVPSAPALVSFWRLVKRGHKQRGPMLVHCSAGVGRTGAFIALDYLMDEAESKHSINVYMCVGKMRLNRMNMVQTVRQYEFVHDVVMEAFNSRRTLYTSSEFDKTFGDGDTLTTSQENMLKEQFKLLKQQTSRLEEDVTSQALLPENSSKNRNQLILPGNRSRPYLCTPVAGRNDYINAVCLPSILRPSTMIVTQTPLPDTVVDFWRLVYDHDCFTIVCLDDSQETEEVYPKDSETLQIGPFSVIHEETKSGTCYTERKLTLVYDKEDSELSVTVFRLRSPSLISNTSSLLELVNEVERIISTDDQQILIHCHDGASVSGVFCSVLNIISRLRLDREVEIFLTIRELQRIRPQFIQSYDQFKLCYKMVKECNRTSNVYANM